MLEAVGLGLLPDAHGKTPHGACMPAIENLQTMLRNYWAVMSENLRSAITFVPSLETEDLDPGRHELALLMTKLRARQIKGVEELNLWSAGNLLPTAYAQGRIIRFLSKLYESTCGLLSVNIGASATSVAAGFNGELALGVYPQYGLGENLAGFLQQTDIDNIMRWLQLDISPNMLREYMFQKSLYPSAIPATKDEQAIAQAIARQALYLAVRTAQKDFPAHAPSDQ